jgi:hypothetical protein
MANEAPQTTLGRNRGTPVKKRLLTGMAASSGARPRKLALAGLFAAIAIAVCGIAAGTLPAHAATATGSSATRFAAAATPYQNEVLDAAMARVPGGTRVSAGKVEWDGNRIALGVTTSATTGRPADSANTSTTADSTLDCTSGYFCAWGDPGYGGTCWMYVAGGTLESFDWAAHSGADCGSVGTWSWKNLSSDRVWKEQDASGGTPVSGRPYFYTNVKFSGDTWCISPGDSNSNVTDTTSRTDGWIYMSSTTSAC